MNNFSDYEIFRSLSEYGNEDEQDFEPTYQAINGQNIVPELEWSYMDEYNVS